MDKFYCEERKEMEQRRAPAIIETQTYVIHYGRLTNSHAVNEQVKKTENDQELY